MAKEIINNPFAAGGLPMANKVIHRTYRMDFENKRITGMIDNLDACRQAIIKALMTKRFAYQIYDGQYGCDIANKIGNSSLTDAYFDSDIPAMVSDALRTVDTVIGVEDVTFNIIARDSVDIEAEIQTIYGGIGISQTISPYRPVSPIYGGGFVAFEMRDGGLYGQQTKVALYQQGIITTEIRDGKLYVQYENVDEIGLEMRNGGLWAVFS